MRVAMIVSNAVDPDPRVEKEAAALAAAGHEVTIVAWDRAGRATEREDRSGFTIRRIGPRARYGGGLRSVLRFKGFWRSAAASVVSLSPDVVHAHDTDTIVPGLRAVRALRGRGGSPQLVVDFHELYRVSRMIPQRGVTGVLARSAVDALERRAIASAALVIVANEGVLPHYRSMGAGDRLLFVPNVPDADLFRPMACDTDDRPFTVTFIGQKRYPRTLQALADAIQPHPDMMANLIGGGPDTAAVDMIARERERVVSSGPVPYEAIPAFYACTDVVHAAYDAVIGNARVCTPGKVFEAMACAKPVLVSAGTWIGGWVQERGVGLAVQGDDPASVSEALVWLRDHPEERRAFGERGRELVESGLNWQATAALLCARYPGLAG